MPEPAAVVEATPGSVEPIEVEQFEPSESFDNSSEFFSTPNSPGSEADSALNPKSDEIPLREPAKAPTEKAAPKTEATPKPDAPSLSEEVIAELKKLGIDDPADPNALAKVDVAALLQSIVDERKGLAAIKSQLPAEVDFGEGLDIPKAPEPKKAEAAPPSKDEGTPPPTEDGHVPELKDGYDHWKSSDDAIKEITAAYAEGDLEKAARMEDGLFARRTHGIVMPMVRALVAEALGKIKTPEPSAETLAAQQKAERTSDEQWAITRLEKATLPVSVKDLIADPTDGSKLTYNGQEFAASLYNQVWAKYPQIMEKIREDDPNPRVAYRKTVYARLTAAAELAKTLTPPPIDPAKAQELVAAGRQAQEAEQTRTAARRAQQGLNGGRSTQADSVSDEEAYADALTRPSRRAIDALF